MPVGRGVIWKKARVESAYQLDMARFARKVDLEQPGCGRTSWSSGLGGEACVGWEVRPPYRLRLFYTTTKRDGQKIDHDYWVDLDTTPCYYGRKRWWFICPNTKCGRRCRILYLAPASDYFLCRSCQNLTYRSQQEGITRGGALFTLAFNSHELLAKIRRAKTEQQRQRAMRKYWRLYAKARPLMISGRKR